MKEVDLDVHTKCILRIVCAKNKEPVVAGHIQRDEL
jgi:hypothetical protein